MSTKYVQVFCFGKFVVGPCHTEKRRSVYIKLYAHYGIADMF